MLTFLGYCAACNGNGGEIHTLSALPDLMIERSISPLVLASWFSEGSTPFGVNAFGEVLKETSFDLELEDIWDGEGDLWADGSLSDCLWIVRNQSHGTNKKQ